MIETEKNSDGRWFRIKQGKIIRVEKFIGKNCEATRVYSSWKEMLKSLPLPWLFGEEGIFYYLDDEDQKFILENHQKVIKLKPSDYASTYNKYAQKYPLGDFPAYYIYDEDEEWFVGKKCDYIRYEGFTEEYTLYVLAE